VQIILITGISGSGKSVALNVLEDAGYFCVDNLPPALLPNLADTLKDKEVSRLAVAVDSRSAISLSSLPESIALLKAQGHEVRVLFLTADTHSLVARYSETRRSHPLTHRTQTGQNPTARRTLIESIIAEREMLEEIQPLGNVIDTSNLSANQLRQWVKEMVEADRAPLTLHFESFGFKFGAPLDADIVFDVRVLPNPHYDQKLRPLTGKDEPVREYLQAQPEVADMLSDITAFIEKWLPAFKRDNRSYLTVALGCTGGQHRSVYMVEQLAKRFGQTESVLVRHRELG